MANNKPTTYIEKLQVGARGAFEDTFTFKIAGESGSLGLPAMTEIQRDIIWPIGDFPNDAWKGGTFYNSTVQRIQFNTGTAWRTLDAVETPSSIAAFYQQYADDAVYVANNGVAVDGSVYYNTTLHTIRVYSAGAWYNDLITRPWANSADFNVGQVVWDVADKIFRCSNAHTSNAAGVIEDDIANWIPMGAHEVGSLTDVDTTGAVDGSVLEWLTDKFIITPKDTIEKALSFKELAADPAAPAAGYVNIYAKDDKRLYLQDSTNKITLMEVPLDVIHYNTFDAATLNDGAWHELVATTATIIRRAHVFDLAGVNMEIGVGAAAAETTVYLTGKGTNEPVDVIIAAGERISVRNNGGDVATFNSGKNLIFNFLG